MSHFQILFSDIKVTEHTLNLCCLIYGYLSTPKKTQVQYRITPEDVGQKAKREEMYQEVFFTDMETANLLKDVLSSIAISFPNSATFLDTQVITNQSLGTAIKVSISDPYLINPQYRVNLKKSIL